MGPRPAAASAERSKSAATGSVQRAGDNEDIVMDNVHRLPLASGNLSPDQIALIHRASKTSSEPPALLVRLATLLGCSASSIAAAPIELIDRQQGLLKLPDPSGRMTEVAVGYAAAAAVVAAAGTRTRGPLVVDTYGKVVTCDLDTEDYAKEILAANVPATSTFDWSLALIRDSIFGQLVDFGTPMLVAAAQAGIGPEWPEGTKREDMLLNQRAAADWWTYRMGLRPPSPFVLAHAVTRVILGGGGANDLHSRRSS
ncbi:hypothetical protein DVW87_02620 [Sphingomonas aracearum]|uniref:Uncharacterized protein n=2 Tax=Sphingomonas TaxID=13687 RepID=A0A369VW43_9SPHN|nr:hypothetical protein DVW87_02620 [Sphingomonas aracearum]